MGRQMAALAGASHPVLKELGLYAFWGATTLVLRDTDGNPFSVHSSKLGKRKKNKWEPIVNWYGAYTLPMVRRNGYATALYRELERRAEVAGCRRIKSLAGSRAGLALHWSLGHECWGVTDKGEVIVDTAFPWAIGYYSAGEAPPQALTLRPMSGADLHKLTKDGLRYDKEEA